MSNTDTENTDTPNAESPSIFSSLRMRVGLIVVSLVSVAGLAYVLWLPQLKMVSLVGHRRGVNDVTFSKDGLFVATGSDDGTIRLWTPEGDQISVISGHSTRVTVVEFSPDSDLIASASGDGNIRLWDVATGIEVLSFLGHEGCVTGLSFTPDGNRLISTAWDLMLKVWDVETGDLIRDIDVPDVPECCVVSQDGTRIVLGCKDKMLRVWDLTTGKMTMELAGHVNAIKGVDLSQNGDMVATASSDWTVRLWSLRDKAMLHEFRHSSTIKSVAFTPDDMQVVAGAKDGFILVYDVLDRSRIAKFRTELNTVITVACSDNDGHVAAGGYNRGCFIWKHGSEVERELKQKLDKEVEQKETETE